MNPLSVALPLASRTFLSIALVLGLAQAPAAAQESAQAYPSKPIRVLVPLAAGGGGDILARRVAHALEPILGQALVVENRPGANGSIGTQAAAQAKPDGYTVLVGAIGPHSVNQFLYSKLPYDPDKDFIPVTLLALYDNVVIVPTSSEIKTFKQLLEAARKKPGKLNYGITVAGSSSHLAVEKLKNDAALDIVGIPYSSTGSAGATTDLMGGRVQFMLDTLVTQYGSISGGKVRALATTGAHRSPDLPNIPTIAESGFPGFEAVGWAGLFVPAGTPQPIVNRLAEAVKKAYESPELKQASATHGLQLIATSPRDFSDFVARERIKWSKVIVDSRIKID